MNIKYFFKHPSKIFVALYPRYMKFLSDEKYLKGFYRLVMGKKLNLKNPQTFTEKLQWLKLYDRKPQYTNMVDKVAVKEFVATKIDKEYIIPTIGIYDTIEDIPWNKLPNQFVLKTSHGGGSSGVVICKDKLTFDKQKAIAKLQKSFNTDAYIKLREWPYKNVPKKIIAEKYITNRIDKDLPDYKWYCFNGEPMYCQVIRDRNTNETIDFYDKDWNHQNFIGLHNPEIMPLFNGENPVPKPTNLKKHIEIAKKLSQEKPFVRVDLYEVNDKTYFGELTFFPASGLGIFTPEEWNNNLGELLKLPNQNREGE